MHARPELAEFQGRRMHWNGRGKHAFWEIEDDSLFISEGRERAEKRHPAQKPEALMRRIVELFSDLDEWVLDPFCGSGATGIAALKLGRKVILCDSDLKWAEYTAERVQALVCGPMISSQGGPAILETEA